MRSHLHLWGMAIVLIAATAAQALPIDLYANPDTGVGLQGTAGVGKARNQVFSPTYGTALPSGSSATLSPSDLFNSVSMHFLVDTVGESATVNLRLYAISGNVGSTLTAIKGGTAIPIAETGNLVLNGKTDQWITLNLPTAQSANATYIASTKLVAFSGAIGMDSRGTLWSGTRAADGHNDAYTDTTFNNNRLYSIRLGVVPEPATALFVLLGGLVFGMRRRS